jgi:hypothetical protein
VGDTPKRSKRKRQGTPKTRGKDKGEVGGGGNGGGGEGGGGDGGCGDGGETLNRLELADVKDTWERMINTFPDSLGAETIQGWKWSVKQTVSSATGKRSPTVLIYPPGKSDYADALRSLPDIQRYFEARGAEDQPS